MATSQSYAVLNAVARDKLGQVLARVLEKMAANESEVFTASEKDQLKAILALSHTQIDAAVAVAWEIFQDAAIFGHVDRNLLLSRGVGDGVVQAVEKTWMKRGRPLAAQIAAVQAVEMPALALQKTDWRLHLEMGSSKRSGQSQPTAIFQLELADKSSPTDGTERLDVELSHAELRSLFLQLNVIQAELDAPPTPSAA
ncbi:COMM domain-containing protein 10 [Phytophthora pseudosyringae]|uniref:COMM domain-containing protein 10 n=1 Tax=Phytophthora pseudosyringae TaxID=221518 RepID=A0A8T1VLJ1_9STRA|nr:COMM domain-containing protein 10 [Phytophthora pseudosyringae]